MSPERSPTRADTGDVQPYVALALALITSRGHRVRIATHPDFESFVTSANARLRGLAHNGVALEGRLEFFNAGGDPKSLMEYMVNSACPGTGVCACSRCAR